MKDLGYGKGYQYDPDMPDGVSTQPFLPGDVAGRRFYRPGELGFERTVADRLAWFERKRAEARSGEGSGEPGSE